jgi:hypothetical protein
VIKNSLSTAISLLTTISFVAALLLNTSAEKRKIPSHKGCFVLPLSGHRPVNAGSSEMALVPMITSVMCAIERFGYPRSEE